MLRSARTIVDFLRHWALRKPDETSFLFLEHGERAAERISFSDLDWRARAIAGHLIRHDLRGRQVLLIYPPGLDYVTAFCACLYAGVIAVPVPTLLPKRSMRRIEAIAHDAEPAAILTWSRLLGDDGAHDALPAGLTAIPWIATDTICDIDTAWQPAGLASDDIAFLQYTSGSTTTPKGVVITHGNLLANQAMIRQAFGHGQDTRFVSWLPIFHDMGLVGNVLQPIYLGVPCVLMSPLAFLQKPIRWLRAIGAHGGTTSGAPNFAYELCLRQIRAEQCEGLDLSSWKVAFCGAEPVRPATLSRFAERFASFGFRADALYPCYGLSEATLFVSGGRCGAGMRTLTVDGAVLATQSRVVPSAPDAPSARVLASSGRSWDGQRLVIADPGTGQPLPPGRVGEILAAGPHIGRGYWRRPDDSAHAFGARPAGDHGPSFLRTGDLGFMDGEDLFVIGRLKDLIIVRGAKHHPEDIEATVAASHPALSPNGGAVVMAETEAEPRIVVLHEIDRRSLAGLDTDQVVKAAFTAVCEHHGIRPDEVRLLRPGALPRTSSGKVQRHLCRQSQSWSDGTVSVVSGRALTRLATSREVLDA